MEDKIVMMIIALIFFICQAQALTLTPPKQDSFAPDTKSYTYMKQLGIFSFDTGFDFSIKTRCHCNCDGGGGGGGGGPFVNNNDFLPDVRSIDLEKEKVKTLMENLRKEDPDIAYLKITKFLKQLQDKKVKNITDGIDCDCTCDGGGGGGGGGGGEVIANDDSLVRP